MIKVKTIIKDIMRGVYLERYHEFRTKSKMLQYKQNLVDSIDDNDVIVSFSTYVKEN